MNILIVSQYFWPENFRINELAYELSQSGNKVIVLTGYPNYPEGKIYQDFLRNRNKFREYKGIKIIRVPHLARGKTRFSLLCNYLSFTFNASILGLLKLYKYKFDSVFIFQTSPVFVGIPASIISYFKKSSQIMWILDLWPETLSAVGIFKRKWQIEIIRKFVNVIYSRCDVLLTQSKSFKKEIKNFERNRIIYFPAWSESDFINASKEPAKEIKFQKDKFTLMFAGNIGEAQDFPSIIKTADYLIKLNFNDFRIVIIGEGRKKDWLRSEIKKRKLDKHFELLDKYPLKRIPSFFAHADALLVSLTKKDVFKLTIPGKVQTYLSSGIPILGMIEGEGASVIRDSKSGYVCNSGDYKNLSKFIIKLSKINKKKRIELGLNGINYCKKEFNKRTLMKRLERIIINACLKKPYTK